MLGLEMFLAKRKADKKQDLQITTTHAYMSGFMPLDYANGMRVRVFPNDTDTEPTEEYDSVGLVSGTLTTFIADPGLGKTTLAQQIAVQIASQYESSWVVHEDIEQSSNINRVNNITAMPSRWLRNHYVIYQDTHSEQIMDRFLDHAKLKLNNRKEFEYKTGLKDIYGNEIVSLIPTVVIIDSLSVMRSEEASITDNVKNMEGIDDTTGNMQGARNAKFNSEIFKQILPWAKKANILIMLISQITNKLPTGFLPQARDLIGLGENEKLSGGKAVVYLANQLIRLKNKGQLTPDKDYHVNGAIIMATFLKSRTNSTNVPIELIFDKQNGFSKALTLLHYGINNNIVKKAGQKYVITGYDNLPFAKYTFCEIAAEHPELLVALYDQCLPHLQKYLGVLDRDSEPDDSDDDSGNLRTMSSLMDDIYDDNF